MAYPFQPMTTKLLKKLTKVNLDSDSTIESPDLPAVFETQNLQTTIESNPQRSETNQSNLRTNNRY
jgi:hypothetical protein